MFDRRLLANFDWVLLLLTLVLCALGVASVYSASQGYTGAPDYWLRQIYWIGLGLGAGMVVLLVDFRTWGQWSYVFHGLVVLSLVVLLVYGAGTGRVARWFMVGPIAVQPSEFAKFSTILAIAYYFRDGRRVGNLGVQGVLVPIALVLVPFFLIVQQPDLGTALLLLAVFFPVIVLAGLRLRLLLILVGVSVLAVVALVASFTLGYYQIDRTVTAHVQRQGTPEVQVAALRAMLDERFYLPSGLTARLDSAPLLAGDQRLASLVREKAFRPYISYVLRPYQQQRLVTFVNPEADPLGAGYHVIQSRVAVGSGGITGKGYGESTQGQLNFLPARHTDFVFAIFAEEWGFLGSMGLLALYGALILRGLSILFQTNDRFSAFATMGIVSILTCQVLINTGMAIGLLPVVGVPLPFFSYGGSSMITMLLGISILLNIRMRRFLWT